MTQAQTFADQVRTALRAPDLDVQAAMDAGDILISPQPPTGFRVIGYSGAGVVAVHQALWYRLSAYSDELDIVDRLVATGVTDFHQVLSALRKHAAASSLTERKVHSMRPQNYFGHQTIARPHMGQHLQMLKDVVAPFHHLILQNVFRTHITSDVDTVFDVGCGTGDILAELISSDPHDRIRYFGGEIALNGRACLERLGRLQGKKNVNAVEFDLRAPDFTFLQGTQRLLLISNFALVYARPFPENFFPKLFAVVPNVHAVLFEPMSFALPELTNSPLFTRERAQSYNIAENLYPILQSLHDRGIIQIEEIVPDMTGLTTFSAVTLLRFRTIEQR